MAGVVFAFDVAVPAENDDRWDLEVLAAAAHWALQLMGNSLRSWSNLIVRRRQSRLRSRCFVEGEMIPSACRRTLQRWKLATVCQVHMRLVADRHKVKVLHSWRGVVRKSSPTRILARKSGLRQCHTIFGLWRKATARCLRCRRILAIQRCRWMVKTCGKAIAAWRLRSTALAAMQCRIGGRCRMLLEMTVMAWRQLCSQRLWGRTRLEMRTEHASMLRVFGDWKWQVTAELTLRSWVSQNAVRKLQFSWTAWRKLLVHLELGRCHAEEAVKQREAKGRSSAFQQWKWLALQRKKAVAAACCRDIKCLKGSFFSWRQSVKTSKLALKLDVKQTVCLQRGVWRVWRQHHAIQIASQRRVHKHLAAEAFRLWRIASVVDISALQEHDESMDLLEVSASTEHAQSGKDTDAPDDVNRTLSDLSGLTLTEGSPILLAFESSQSSPEDLLKTFSQLIPNPASPEISAKKLEKLQELRQVPSTFQAGASVGASTPQAPQASQALHLAFLPSPASRQPTPVSTPSDGSYSHEMLTPTPPWPDALKAAGVQRQRNQRESRWRSEILKAWLGVCLQKKTLTVEQALQHSASSRHLRAWQQLCFVQIYRRNIIFRRCFGQWHLLQQTYAVKIRSSQQRKLQNALGLAWHHWQNALRHQVALAEGQHQKSLNASLKQLLGEWRSRSRLWKWCQCFQSKQQLRLLVSSCKVWKGRCDQRRRAQSIFDGRMFHLTAKTWIAWCDYRSLLMRCTERMTGVLQQCIGSTLGRRAALQRWALQTRRARDATHRAGLQPVAAETFVQKRMRKVQLLAHLTQWRARWQRHLLHRLMNCWRKVLLRRLVLEKLNMQKMQELITVLDQWKLAVQLIMSFRLMLMRHAIQRWHSWRGSQQARRKVQKICRDVAQSSALRHWSRLHLARRHSSPICHERKAGAMLAWIVAVKITCQQHFVLRGSVRQWHDMMCKVRAKRSRRSLHAWGGVITATKRQRSLVQHWRSVAVELRWQRLSKSFRSWQLYHSVFQKARDMESISRTEVLKDSLVAWMQAVGRWRAKQHVEVICRRQRRHQMLSAWTLLHRATILAHCGPAHRRIVSCWAFWQLGVAISKAWKRNLHKVVNLWRAGLLVAQLQRQKRLFRAWHSCLRSRRRQEACQRTMLLMWMAFVEETRHCRRSRSFAMWRAIVKVTVLERHHLVEVWRCWQQLLEEQHGVQRHRQQHRILFAWHEVLLASRRRQTGLRMGFRTWRQAAAMEKAKRQKNTKEWILLWRLAIRNTKVLDLVWVQWQLLSTATAQRRARGILWLWYNESHQRRQGKALLGAWRVVVSLSCLPCLFHAWRAVLLSLRMSKSQLRFVLRWWRSLVQQVKHLKGDAFKAWRAVLQMRRLQLLSKVLAFWRACQIASRHDRCLQLLLLKSWVSIRDLRIYQAHSMSRFAKCCERSMVMSAEASARSVAQVFFTWRSYSKRRTTRRKCCTRAFQVARHRPLRVAFDHFRSGIFEQRRLHQRCGPLAQELWNCGESRVLSAWSRWQQHTRCLRLQHRRRGRIVAKALQVWQVHHLQRKSMKAAIKGVVARRTHRLSLTYLQNWYSAARRCRLSEWMLRWRCAVAGRQTQQRDLAMAVFQKRLLQRAMGHWAMSLHCGQLRGWSLKVPRFSTRFRPRDFSELTMLATTLRVAKQ